ncbi:unnamed protein product [Brassica oleracea var. botrytis]|uniref:ATP-dependent DNA helicase n=2 Tax=Brassica TaxID=3705 RepID=A0A078GNQ1_BRANA|nr:unnamed protein product [Brassica napus]CDY26941.1 BnaC09g36420D [Brassica napus]
MAEKYQDAMALCPKIDEYLRISGDSSANDRPDIESRAGRENVCFNEIDKFVSVELLDRIIDHEEFCNKTSAIKYLFKYITKGVDKATIVLENKSNDENEIENYLDCRYVSACESMWRNFKFEIHHQHPAVQRLSIYLPGQKPALFNDSSDLEQVVSICEFRLSMFMAYLETNKIDPDARKLTYVQFPTKYVWNKTEHTWTKRKIGQSIGRLYNVHPSSGELYYLRLLINHLKGPTSFEDILTVNGIEYKKFHESCVARGLLDIDEEWHDAMTEAATWATSQQLQELFVMLLVHCEYDQSLSNYTDLPKLDKSSIGRLSNTVLADEQYLHVQCLKDSSKEQISLLNEEQKKVYEVVLDSVHNNSGKLFFLYVPGGTGKTFVYNTIINKLRSETNIVIPVATSGIAALLLPGGRTAHSRFKIALNLFDDSVCDITCGTMLADLLIQAKLIIWDEAPMTHKYAFEALDRSLRDIMSKTDKDAHLKPFGGKTILLGGDFRQTLPIISQGTRQDCVAASINRSYLWEFVQIFVLS